MLKRISGLVWVAVVGLVVPWGAAPQAKAQDVAHEQVAEAPAIELDLQGIIDLAGSGGRGIRFTDTVWEIRPENGRRILLLPIRVAPGEAAYELSRPAIGVRSGRFIGWYLPEADNDAGRRAASNPPYHVDLALGLETLLLGTGGETGDGFPGTTAGADDELVVDAFDPVPAQAPRLARSIVVYPDASVGWEMDRSFNRAQLRPAGGHNLYGYKIDPRALRDEEPARPGRVERGSNESSRDFSSRRRQAQQDYRDAVDIFRALRDTVRALPDEFREPVPGVIYAVYDAPDGGEWSFTGEPPFPWRIEQAALDAIAQIARGARASAAGTLNSQTQDSAVALRGLAERGSVLDQRVIALAAYQGRLAAVVERGDPGYELLRLLLDSEDQAARTVALVSIAQADPPTRAVARLLAEAAHDASSEMAHTLELASLQRFFRIEAAPDGDLDALLMLVNNALSTELPAARLLEILVDVVGPARASANARRRGGGSPGGDVVQALVSQIDFEQINDRHIQPVIAMVIRRSPDSVLAAGWLDHQLLQSPVAGRVDMTLQQLAAADRPEPGEDRPAEAPVIEGVIALATEGHGFLQALRSGEPARRDLAWQALRHFTIAGTGGSGGEGRQIFDRIVESGLDMTSFPETPTQLVDFIANQDDEGLARHARARMLDLLMAEGIDPEVVHRAARQVVGGGQDYSEALRALSPSERGAVVAVVYGQLTEEVPGVTGLVQGPGGELTRWLAGQWQAGILPDEGAWAGQAGGYDQLLRQAGDDDVQLALGAGAALVIRAGGTREHQEQMAQVVDTIADRSPESIERAWSPIRREIFAARLLEAAGAYRLELAVFEPRQNPAPGTPGTNRNRPRAGV